jgi:hypothetical protein
MSILSAIPILGSVMLLAVSLAGCESKSKREFNAGCQSGGTDRSTCSCVYDQLEGQYSPAVMEKLGEQTLSNFDLPQDFIENMALAAQYCQSR